MSPLRQAPLPRRLASLLAACALLAHSFGPAAAVSSAGESSVRTVAPAAPRAAKGAPRRQGGAAYRAGQLLVRFRDDVTEQERAAVAAREGAGRRRLRGDSAVELWTLAQGKSVEPAAATLSARAAVEFAEPNYLITADQLNPFGPRFNERSSPAGASRSRGAAGPDTGTAGPNMSAAGPTFGAAAAGPSVGFPRAWEKPARFARVVIAVIDGGIDFSRRELASHRWSNPSDSADGRDDDGNGLADDLSGWDWIADSGEATDPGGHGTAVAGLIVAGDDGRGASAGAAGVTSLMSLRVLDERGAGDVASAVEAIDYASARGAHVVNCSWGTDSESRALFESVARANARGALVVAAAGNDSRNIDAAPRYPASFDLPNVVAAAATDDLDQLTPWSNWGAWRAHVAAPGVDLLTTAPGGGYRTVSGTSAAAALVAGVAGLVKTLRPSLPPRRVRDLLARGARRAAGLAGRVAAGGVLSAGGSSATLASVTNAGEDGSTGAGEQGSGHASPDISAATPARPLPPDRRPVTPLHPIRNLPDLDGLRRLKPYDPETPAPIPSTRPNHRRSQKHTQDSRRATSTPGGGGVDFITSKYISPLRSVQVAFNALVGGRESASPVTARDFLAAGPHAAPAAEFDEPPSLSVTAASDTRIDLGWTASAAGTPLYRLERSLSKAGPYLHVDTTSAVAYSDTAVTRGASGTTYLYRVCVAGGPNSCSSPYSNVALGTAYSFFDPILVSYSENPAQATTIKARHVVELRDAVNAVRRAAGLSEAAWEVAGPGLSGAIIRARHVQELRDRLSEGLSTLGIPADAFTDATLATGPQGTLVRKVHFEELRRYSTALPAGWYSDIQLDTSGIWAEARLNPANRTGGAGVDLLSGNANWRLPLVSLTGRSGLDLGLSLSYNSRVWTKSDTQVTTNSSAWVGFDLDRGFPAPGFRLGFPTIEGFTADGGRHGYLLTTANGDHVELRQAVKGGSLFEATDSSYMQLTQEPGGATLTLRPGDGSRMTYSLVNSQHHCTEIKDRNGNYLSVSYDSAGQIKTVADTLGRVITFNYDQYQNLGSITQQWRDEQLGQNYTRTWASFGWGEQKIETNFTDLTVIGIQNGTTIPVLNQVGLPDGTLYRFEYTRWGQVRKVSRHTLTSNEPPPSPVFPGDYTERSSTAYGLRDDAGAEGDCPRVTSVSAAAEEWQGGAAAVTTYQYGGDDATGRWGEATMPAVEPAPAGSAGARYRETYGTGWQRGLVTKAEEFAPGASAAAKTTTTEWAQNNQSLQYEFNPRAAKIVVEDSDANKRQTVFEYDLQSSALVKISAADAAGTVSLPTRVREETGAGALLRSTRLVYENAGPYLDAGRRIVGLVKQRTLHRENDALVSKITNHYDQADEPAAGNEAAVEYLKELNQSQTPTVRHDPAYGINLRAGRGNLNIVRRWDANAPEDGSKVSSYKTGYSTTGSVVLSIDPEKHRSTIDYADSFSESARNGTKFAYPTRVTDPDGHSSRATYNYDFGAVTESQSPMPDQTEPGVYGPKRLMTYDKAGRLSRIGNSFNAAYTRWVYPVSLTSVQTFTLLKDGSSPTESFSAQFFDGAGRVRATSSNMAEAGRYSGQQFEYDRAGRLANKSNPTEITADWTVAGDDAAAGWVYTAQQYDWRGRITLTTDAAGYTTEFQYGGCGCAGGETVLSRDTVGRRQKTFKDVLGRVEKVVALSEQHKGQPLSDSGDPYSTTVTTYNALDQVTRVRVHQGGVGGPYQEATSEYDGYGRLWKSKAPIQTAPTEYEYNADDTVRHVTDARGVRTQFVYNARHLPTNVNHNVTNVTSVPTWVGTNQGAGTQVSAAPSVIYTYDAAGNRKSVATQNGEGGGVAYTYDALSRVVSEARTIPGPVGTAAISYEYAVGGALSKVTDGKAQTSFTYAFDAAGQVSGVTGTGFEVAETTFASQMKYRAWGALKSAGYGNGTSLSLGYDRRGLPLTYSAGGVKDKWGQPLAVGASFLYHADGRVRFAGDTGATNSQHDRAYSYDHVGRIREAYSGGEARAVRDGTPGVITISPFRHSYSYDAWGNMTGRSGSYWQNPDEMSESFDTQNRNPQWEYDAAGHLISRHEPSYGEGPYEPLRHTYDAAGRLAQWTQLTSRQNQSGSYSTTRTTKVETYDGDGLLVKSATTRQLGSGTPTTKTSYHLRSSVLGGAAVSDYDSAGARRNAYVSAGGRPLAQQQPAADGTRRLLWEHTDPVTGDALNTDTQGRVAGRTRLDPLGVNAGDEPPLTRRDPAAQDYVAPAEVGIAQLLGESGLCYLDGIETSCGLALRLRRSGAVSQCPDNDCSPRRYGFTINGVHITGLTNSFQAFADGAYGFLPLGVRYVGDGLIYNSIWTGGASEKTSIQELEDSPLAGLIYNFLPGAAAEGDAKKRKKKRRRRRNTTPMPTASPGGAVKRSGPPPLPTPLSNLNAPDASASGTLEPCADEEARIMTAIAEGFVNPAGERGTFNKQTSPGVWSWAIHLPSGLGTGDRDRVMKSLGFEWIVNGNFAEHRPSGVHSHWQGNVNGNWYHIIFSGGWVRDLSVAEWHYEIHKPNSDAHVSDWWNDVKYKARRPCPW